MRLLVAIVLFALPCLAAAKTPTIYVAKQIPPIRVLQNRSMAKPTVQPMAALKGKITIRPVTTTKPRSMIRKVTRAKRCAVQKVRVRVRVRVVDSRTTIKSSMGLLKDALLGPQPSEGPRQGELVAEGLHPIVAYEVRPGPKRPRRRAGSKVRSKPRATPHPLPSLVKTLKYQLDVVEMNEALKQ